MIVLMGYMYLSQTDLPEFLVEIEQMAADSRGEKGCLFYGLALEDAASGRVLLAQQWLDKASFTAHLDGPNALHFQQRWASRVRLDVRSFEPVALN